jgi:hypothetical protein
MWALVKITSYAVILDLTVDVDTEAHEPKLYDFPRLV